MIRWYDNSGPAGPRRRARRTSEPADWAEITNHRAGGDVPRSSYLNASTKFINHRPAAVCTANRCHPLCARCRPGWPWSSRGRAEREQQRMGSATVHACDGIVSCGFNSGGIALVTYGGGLRLVDKGQRRNTRAPQGKHETQQHRRPRRTPLAAAVGAAAERAKVHELALQRPQVEQHQRAAAAERRHRHQPHRLAVLAWGWRRRGAGGGAVIAAGGGAVIAGPRCKREALTPGCDAASKRQTKRSCTRTTKRAPSPPPARPASGRVPGPRKPMRRAQQKPASRRTLHEPRPELGLVAHDVSMRALLEHKGVVVGEGVARQRVGRGGREVAPPQRRLHQVEPGVCVCERVGVKGWAVKGGPINGWAARARGSAI